MSFQTAIDKLVSINSALAETGDNFCTSADDGSDEWETCSPGYETGLGFIMESHSWGYATRVKTLQPSPIAPQDSDWDTAYPIPSDCVHLIWAKINDSGVSNTASLLLYSIMGTPTGPVIVLNAQGGPPPPTPPQVPAQVTIKYISNEGALCDATNGTPTMILSLKAFVMSSIYRGMHEDTAEADKMWLGGERLLQMARTRHDQQLPKRNFFNSRMRATRLARRPWPPTGTGGWGGPGGAAS